MKIRLMLSPVPWAGRVWALPFLTALMPPERYSAAKGRRHKTLLDFGRQLAFQARRWLPGRGLVLVADSSVSSLLLQLALRRCGLTVITRLRLDAALFDPAPPRAPGAMGRPRKTGKSLPTLAKVAADLATAWRFMRVETWYGGGTRDLQIASATAVWRHHRSTCPASLRRSSMCRWMRSHNPGILPGTQTPSARHVGASRDFKRQTFPRIAV